MPQHPDPDVTSADQHVGRKLLDDIKAEPVPEKLVELAVQLETVLAAKRAAAKPGA